MIDAGGRRNEPLDLRVYNICAAAIFLSEALAHVRYSGVNEFGGTKEEMARWGYIDILKQMEADILSSNQN